MKSNIFETEKGNTLIIGTILFVKELRQNPTFMLIVNLSASDFVVSVVVDTSTIVGKNLLIDQNE